MRCMICGAGIEQAGWLERVNAKGKPGLWACQPHYASARAHFPDDDPRAPPPEPRFKLVEEAPEKPVVDAWPHRAQHVWIDETSRITPETWKSFRYAK